MADGKATVTKFTVKGDATCVGGRYPDHPLAGFPRLAWMAPHPAYGHKVFIDDQKATVEDIALAACETPDYEALAARFGTTTAHISDAIAYAVKVGFLGA